MRLWSRLRRNSSNVAILTLKNRGSLSISCLIPAMITPRDLGLRFKLPDDLKAVYLDFGIDLAAHNGESSWTLPMPGRFVVDRAGIVGAVDVDPDY